MVHGIGALTVTGWVPFARQVSQLLRSLEGREFVLSHKSLGATPLRTLLTTLLPNCTGPLITQGVFSLAGVISAEAALSFLGMSIGGRRPSWGTQLAEAKDHATERAEALALRFDLGEGFLELGLVMSSLYFLGRRQMFPIGGGLSATVGVLLALSTLLL